MRPPNGDLRTSEYLTEAGTPSTHPILGDKLRALRRLQREQEPKSPFVFTSERGAPFTTGGFGRMASALSGFGTWASAANECPLCPQKRTWLSTAAISALCQKADISIWQWYQ
jgi:hypothetical protein